MPDTRIQDLTAEIYAILDQRRIHALDGHIALDTANLSKGVISGRVLAAHDQAEILKFSVAVAL